MEKKMEKAIIDIIIVIAGATGCFFYLYGHFYESLALWLRSETSRETSNYLNYLLIFVIFLFTVHLVRTWRKISSRIKDLKKLEKMKGDQQIEQHENLSPGEIRAIHNRDYEEARKQHSQAKRLVIFQSLSDLIFFFFITAVLSFPYSQEFYRKHLIAVFRQKFTAAKVLMDDQEASLILDKVREIKSKQDYLDIINELEHTIDAEVQQDHDKKVTITE